MNKVLPVIIVIIVAVGLWFAFSGKEPASPVANKSSQTVNSAPPAKQVDAEHGQVGSAPMSSEVEGADEASNEEEGEQQIDDRPATERYKTAEEALAAVKAGAADYDDLVLDQFSQLGENCTWCPAFYSSVKELMFAPDTRPDQRSYYAEVLAVSGKLENVKTLVEAITNAKNSDEADLYAEALELTAGKADIVRYLGEQLNQPNDTLRESAVAAITNQGTKQAVELLYKNTVERGDPEGYYNLGIGLGEVVPDEEAIPYLQDLATKRDQYSHLAIKSLLNAGLDGVKVVMDLLSNSKSSAADKDLLKGAKDHVSYDDDVVNYLRQIANSGKSGAGVDFAKEVLADFDQAEKDADTEGSDSSVPASLPGAAAPMSVSQ